MRRHPERNHPAAMARRRQRALDRLRAGTLNERIEREIAVLEQRVAR